MPLAPTLPATSYQRLCPASGRAVTIPEDGKRSLQVGEGAACVIDHEAHITQDGAAGLGSPEDTRGHRLLLFCPA